MYGKGNRLELFAFNKWKLLPVAKHRLQTCSITGDPATDQTKSNEITILLLLNRKKQRNKLNSNIILNTMKSSSLL